MQTNNRPLIVALEGIIASGKTTLLSQLQKHSQLNIKIIPEPIEAWKNVKRFNMGKYLRPPPILSPSNITNNGIKSNGIINGFDNNINGHNSSNHNNINNDSKRHCKLSEETRNEKLLKPDRNDISNMISDESQFELLSQMYNDPTRWSYSFQIWALLTRISSMEYELNKLSNNNYLNENGELIDMIVLERSSHANKIFASVMYKYNRLNDCEWIMYNDMFNYLTYRMPCINGIIYLDCEINKSMTRLKNRNRNGENNVDIDYQKSLQNEHEKWINQMKNDVTMGNNNNNKTKNNQNSDEFHENLDILQCDAKDFLENRNDLMEFDEKLLQFVENQRNCNIRDTASSQLSHAYQQC